MSKTTNNEMGGIAMLEGWLRQADADPACRITHCPHDSYFENIAGKPVASVRRSRRTEFECWDCTNWIPTPCVLSRNIARRNSTRF